MAGFLISVELLGKIRKFSVIIQVLHFGAPQPLWNFVGLQTLVKPQDCRDMFHQSIIIPNYPFSVSHANRHQKKFRSDMVATFRTTYQRR